MSDGFIFAWGVVAFLLAVGPLTFAAYYDYKNKS